MEQNTTQSQLEVTILDVAAGKIQMLRSLMDEPATDENQSSFYGLWRELGALVELGHIANSGLSQAGQAALLEIEEATTDSWRRYPRPAPFDISLQDGDLKHTYILAASRQGMGAVSNIVPSLAATLNQASAGPDTK